MVMVRAASGKPMPGRRPTDVTGVLKMQKLATFGYSCIALATIAAPTHAAEWTNSASVKTGVTYTDNVCLSADNTQDQWVGLVTPAGNISANGARANMNLSGSVEFNTLTDSKLKDEGCSGGSNGNREQFAPRLSGSADAILVENWFYIDGGANITQNQVSPFVSGGGDSLDRTGNTNTTYSYSVSPYISRRFKDAAEATLRYTWNDQYNSTDAVRDSSQESAQALIGGVPGTSRYTWALQGDYSKVSYSDSGLRADDPVNNNDSELKSAQVNQGYQLTRAWQVNGFYGNEWNDFVSTRDDIDGSYWDVGVRWTPNSRTTVDAGTGHRFYGDSPRFAIRYSHKRSAFNANYAKTLTYDRNIRTLDDSPAGNPDFPAPPGVDPGVTTLSDSPILDERFTLGYTFQGRLTDFGVSAFQSEQTRQGGSTTLGVSESTFRGITVVATRTIFQDISLNARMNWNEQEPKGQTGSIARKSETWSGSLGLNRKLGQRMNLGANYVYTDRSSNNGFDEYTENRITLDLNIDL